MAKQKLDRETRKALLNARSLIEAIAKADSNEAETRKRIDHIFEALMGYDTFKHITQEYALLSNSTANHHNLTCWSK